MTELCYACDKTPAEDEYHWWQYVPKLGRDVEVVWKLCEKCCEFACEVVESISNLDDAKERESWPRLI